MNKAGHCWRCEAPCTPQCSRCRVAFYCCKECQKQDKWRHQPNCDAAALKRQCSGCGLEEEGRMKCTSCLKACYCSAECQRNDWERHKYFCQKTVDKTLKLVEEMKALYEDFAGLSFTYYWGNLPAVDLLNLSMNEGEEYSNPMALLLCGVGDPRNVLLSIASLPDVYKQHVNFVLNDICPCTLARTVLLLYILYKGGSDITYAVVRIWYSVCITEDDFTLLTSALQDLSTTAELRTLTEGVMELSADQLSQLKIIWATWLRLSAERKGPWVSRLREKANSSDRGRENGISNYIHAIPKAHRLSTKHFFDTGIFHTTTNSKILTRQNPTLTGRPIKFHPHSVSSDFHYSIPSDVPPFTGWDYKAIKKNHYADSLPKMYTIYLSRILQKSLEKMTSGQVKFHFILCDAQNIQAFLPAAVRYDRITTSNLWDYYPLAVLLTKFKAFLNITNPHAVILTEEQNWPQNFMPEIIHVLPYSYGIDDLCKKALKDTQNPELVDLSGLSSVVEYLNLTDEFFMFLRASLLVSYSDNELASFKRKKKIPSVKSLVDSLGLHLRDFIRNENKVSPFKWALNCRRVVMLRGHERALEWTLTSDSAAEPAVE